jgi:hypothetical protein
MIYRYQVLSPMALSASMIQTILDLWQIDAWRAMDTETFRRQFYQSEFHILTDAEKETIQCIARVNYAFALTIAGEKYAFAELVGLVAAARGRGHGKFLMGQICHTLRESGMQALGFCSRELRPFYEKCGVSIIKDRAPYIYEQVDGAWMPAEDDDILDVNLSPAMAARLRALCENNVAYYTPQAQA